MNFFEKEISIPKISDNGNLLSHLKKNIVSQLGETGLLPIRVVISDSLGADYKCEVGVLDTQSSEGSEEPKLFQFTKRSYESTQQFNVVFLVPTGIRCEIGGHAGDATPVARLLSTVCDHLITHPNVFNASDINEMPGNSLYVEGSTLCRLLMGSVGLKPIRANRILVIIDENPHKIFENAAINSINAARATLGIECSEIAKLTSPLIMKSEYSSSKRAVGIIENVNNVFSTLKKHEGKYDAVAISSIIKVPKHYHKDYFSAQGDMVNPWGGVEAMLTHAISYQFNIPSAHSPMLESRDIANMDFGVVDARMSAEAVSTAFLHCVLKGLHKSPKIVSDPNLFRYDDIISAKDISCLVIPDGCLGLPTLAALEQGIKVIAVKENKNLMKNDLTELPWNDGQFIQVENYLEATGILSAIKNGISLSSIRRPLKTLDISDDSEKTESEGTYDNLIRL